MLFPPIKEIDNIAENILQKRYYLDGESNWTELANRVVDYLLEDTDEKDKEETREMLANRYFILNSPALVNAGKNNGGLLACFVVDMEDTIEDIYKTKLDFALIARKGGGCGTTLTKLRPKNSKVAGSTHGYSGGPVDFYNTICYDMEVLSQSGFRNMAMMGTMSVYHPDILRFLFAKYQEGKMSTTNLSITVDDKFMELVKNSPDTPHRIKHSKWGFGKLVKGKDTHKYYPTLDIDISDNDILLTVGQLFKMITDMAWRNGEPGILFYERLNNSPYKYTKQEIQATNPCVSGDTKIVTVYDGNKTFKELAEKGDDVLVYTFNPETKLAEVGLMRNPRVTRKNQRLIEVEFDSGLKVKCTPDHNFIAFRGNKVQANDLKVGQSIRAFSSSIHKDGHLRVHGWVDGKAKHQYTARMVWEYYNDKVPEGMVIHHKDFKKLNNRITNLQLLTNSLHASFHYDENKRKGVHGFNHKVVSIKDVAELEDVYNGTVDNTHTYIIADPNPVSGNNSGIVSANCGEQPLPPNGSCNLGSLDISKFLNEFGELDLLLLEDATRLAVRLLDKVIDKNSYPTKDIDNWAKNNRPIGVGIMGFADFLHSQKVAYGSDISLELLEFILSFIYKIAEDESIILGKERGIPKECAKLPIPRRNITLLTIAPTGTISLIAGCSSGIEPVFSEITIRTDNTGTYEMLNELIEEDYFRCAVSTNGGKEVTWEEHLDILNSAQRFVDSGVSKTINCPKGTKKETVYKMFLEAYNLPYIKGLTIYRNGSREVEVLSPKKLKESKCPHCGSEMIKADGCTKCTNIECQYSLCEI